MARTVLEPQRMRSVLLSMLAACAYRAGSFSSWEADFAGRRVTVGCVDVAIQRRADHAGGPVLAYAVGNRCEYHEIEIDLKHASLIAKTALGDASVTPYDPDREIRPLPLDGRSVGGEAIEYTVASAGAEVRAICVDAASIVESATSEWQCFSSRTEAP